VPNPPRSAPLTSNEPKIYSFFKVVESSNIDTTLTLIDRDLGQRHNLQSTTLTSLFIKIFIEKLYTPSGSLLEVVLDKVSVKHWEHKS
jgi:hypothetical protein